jgi:hypothetical protein
VLESQAIVRGKAMSSRNKWYWLIGLALIACYLVGIILITGQDLSLHSPAIDNLVKPALTKEETQALVSSMIEDAKLSLKQEAADLAKEQLLGSEEFKASVKAAVDDDREALSKEVLEAVIPSVLALEPQIVQALVDPEGKLVKGLLEIWTGYEPQLESRIALAIKEDPDIYKKISEEVLSYAPSFQQQIIDQILALEPQFIESVKAAVDPVTTAQIISDPAFVSTVMEALLENREAVLEVVSPYLVQAAIKELKAEASGGGTEYQSAVSAAREDTLNNVLGPLSDD